MQNPIRLNDYSEPEPDVAVLRPRSDFYAKEHPSPSDVLLVIEVADTSVEFDREIKVPLYARAGIPEVWLIDLQASIIKLYALPLNGEYQTLKQAARGEAITSDNLPDLTLSVDAVLG